jgi:hypothetical protein
VRTFSFGREVVTSADFSVVLEAFATFFGVTTFAFSATVADFFGSTALGSTALGSAGLGSGTLGDEETL